MSILYPSGYSTTMVNIDELFRRHHPDKIHPEYARRLRAWLISQNGKIGIGGSWRAIQPAKPGFAPEGRSFHQTQTFAGGRQAFCAVDLVHINPGNVHRSPTWAEVLKQGNSDTKLWGLHCNVDGEPWHMQPIEIDGYGTWESRGKPDIQNNYPILDTTPIQPGPALVFAYPGTPLRLGSQGDAVKLVQAVVGATTDGDFGLATERRVKDYQTKNGLLADGVVGPVTWKKMFG
jgi:peptidoglycan hydrolase-like protein with peptidoglycan-binding domain